MKRIKLTRGLFALVDDSDYDELNKYKWQATKPTNNNSFYATRCVGGGNGVRKSMKMHRQILGLTNPKIKGDHIDHNGLNNQRNNLRVATEKQNGQSKTSHKNSSSKYLGVTYYKRQSRWMAQIRVDNKLKCLGYFKKESDAAKKYDEAARNSFGEFANLNFKDK